MHAYRSFKNIHFFNISTYNTTSSDYDRKKRGQCRKLTKYVVMIEGDSLMAFPFKFRFNSLYSKLLLAITISLTILIFGLSAILYFKYSEASLNNEARKNKSMLHQISYSMTYMDSLARKFISAAITGPNVPNLLYSPSDDRLALNNALRNLDQLLMTNDYVYSIYTVSLPLDRIASTEDGGFHTTKTFYDKDVVSLIQQQDKQALSGMPIARTIPKANSSSQFANVYTYILPYQTGPENKTDEAVVVNINASALRELIASLNIDTADTGNDIVVIDSNGTVVNHMSEKIFLRNIQNEKYIQTVLASAQTSGNFKANISGQSYNVTFFSSEMPEWKFISLTSYKSFMAPVDAVKSFTLYTSMAVLLVGLLLSFLLSKTFYTLFRRLIETLRLRSDELERKQRDHRPSLKNNYLKDLVLGYKIIEREELQAQKEDLGIKTNLSSSLRIILFRIDYYRDFQEKYNERDQGLLKFGMMNIIENISSALFTSGDIIEMDADNFVLLLESTGSEEEEMDILTLTQNIQHSVREYLHFSLSATVSETIKSGALLNQVFSDISALSLYRLVAGHGSIITPAFRSTICLNPSPFPEGKAKLIIDSLKLGHLDKAKKYYYEIVLGLTGMTYETTLSSFMHLMFMISSAFHSVADNSNSRISNEVHTFYSKIDRLETIDEINQSFETIFNEIVSTLDTIKHSKHNVMVILIQKMIADRYSDKNLNLSMLAEEVQMSNVYVGRIFKEATGKSVAEHITNVRMDRVKQLLQETSLSTKEILDQCGWEDLNYFYTLFKKHVGVPLSQYRLLMKSDQEEVNENRM